jgi:hypothetical protein
MRCPVCKAENVREQTCRRCKAELSLLWEVEAQREALLASARCHLARFDRQKAVGDEDPAGRLRARIERRLAGENAVAAARLRAGVDALRVTAMARLLGRDFAGAWRAYLAAKPVAGTPPNLPPDSGTR